METLNRSMSLAQKRRTVIIQAPEWDCQVILRELSAGQLRELDQDISKQLSLMIIDDSGNRVYSSSEDIAELREMPAALQNRLLEAAAVLNGLSQAVTDQTIKNSAADPKLVSVSA